MKDRFTTVAGEIINIRKLYKLGIIERGDAITMMVALGFSPMSAAASLDIADRNTSVEAANFLLPEERGSISNGHSYPSNLSKLTTPDLAEHVLHLRLLLQKRILRHWTARTLLVYDGSIFDRLVFDLVSRTLPPDGFDVVCTVRPCMKPSLQAEVYNFSEVNGFPLVGYNGDCEVDFKTLQVRGPRCTNITSVIECYFSSEGGICFVGGISSDNHIGQMEEVSSFYGRSVIEFDMELGDVSWTTTNKFGKAFKTILLLHGLMPYEIVACSLAFTQTEIGPQHVPECYVPCYFEVEKRQVKTIIEKNVDEIRNILETKSAELMLQGNWSRNCL